MHHSFHIRHARQAVHSSTLCRSDGLGQVQDPARYNLRATEQHNHSALKVKTASTKPKQEHQCTRSRLIGRNCRIYTHKHTRILVLVAIIEITSIIIVMTEQERERRERSINNLTEGEKETQLQHLHLNLIAHRAKTDATTLCSYKADTFHEQSKRNLISTYKPAKGKKTHSHTSRCLSKPVYEQPKGALILHFTDVFIYVSNNATNKTKQKNNVR